MTGEANIDSIFCQAVEIASEAKRDEYLDKACGTDAQLRARLEKLLAAHAQAGSFLPEGDEPTMDLPLSTQRPGAQIGPYKLRERLGEGGMGVVWAAEQKKPLRRKVALKVIKPGMDTEQVLARFEAEREALSLMDHSNIARALDAGTTDQGRPYFVMELIRGVPITDYCDAHKLTVRERLELFTHVCKAVQHAHQKGIIHRDIKPSNVLVTEQDGKPVAKVIDFGVAKALHQPLTDQSVYTGVFQAIGTLAYMSPEQAALSATDIDTRADVYGLGVLLYELLTGSPPFERKQLEGAALDEALRLIREIEPSKPSTRISALGERATVVSDSRSTNPTNLCRSIRGDLDWLIMTALEKDRSRRYESASRLAEDIQHYLNNEPVTACPHSIAYRLKKSVHRHRGPIAAFLLLLLCLIGTSLSLYKTKATMRRLMEELQSKAVAAAMNGDEVRMLEAVKDAQLAGATKAWAESVKAICALFSGDTERARELLTSAIDNNEDTLTVHALLALSHMGAGDVDGYANECLYLLEREPTKQQDKLFYAMAVAYLQPELAYELANEAFDHSRSPVALVVRSRARAVMASDTGDLTQIHEAVADATAATVLLPNSPTALAECLFAHMLAINLGKNTEDEAFLVRHREAGQRLAERLEEYPQFATGHWFAAEFYMELDDVPKARPRYKDLLSGTNSAYFRDIYTQFLLRQNNVDAARQMLPTEGRVDPVFLGTHTLIATDFEVMRKKVAKQIIASLEESPQFLDDEHLVRPRQLGMLCLLGFGGEAKTQARRIWSTEKVSNPLCAELFAYFAGESNREEVLKLAAGKRNLLCTVHLVLHATCSANRIGKTLAWNCCNAEGLLAISTMNWPRPS